jgi:hypothetical protein
MGEVRRRANQQNSVGIDQSSHRSDIDLELWGGAWNTVQLHTKVVAGLDECSMSSVGDNPSNRLVLNCY